MKRIFLSGARGFFGSHACRFLDPEKFTILAGTREPQAFAARFPDIEAVHLDITDQKSAAEGIARSYPDVIVHAAAMSEPGTCHRNPVRARECNVIGTGYIFSVAVALGLPFVFLSTDLVFDGSKGQYTELDSPKPLGEYAATKLQAENIIREQQLTDKWAILRSALMFGHSSPGRIGFPGFALRDLEEGRRPTLFTDQYRSPVYVKDVVRAVETVIEQNLYAETFHVGGPERINRADFFQRYCRLADIDDSRVIRAPMSSLPDYHTRVADVSLSSAKLARQSAWRSTPLDEAFADMLAVPTTKEGAV